MSNYYNWKESINENELSEIINILKNNGIIIFPTETVYGIGGNALCDEVIDKIYEVKQRPREKALNIMLASIDDIEKYAEITSELDRKIIKNFMPGPITIILKKKPNFGNGFTLSNNTIGIRIPDNKIINSILKKLDFPIIAPSADISGKPSAVEVSDIIKNFDNKVDAIINGGRANLGISSTIVQVTNNKIKILRQGRITKDDILKKI